jgi:hypothetical protein
MARVLCNDWRELSEAASREQDPQKLMELIEQLNQALEDREKQVKGHRPIQQRARRQDSLQANRGLATV